MTVKKFASTSKSWLLLHCINYDFESLRKGLIPKLLQVRVVASLPCYSPENVNQQRGGGVFERSIKGLKLLNQAGYGKKGGSLILDLVYNPNGAFLAPSEAILQVRNHAAFTHYSYYIRIWGALAFHTFSRVRLGTSFCYKSLRAQTYCSVLIVKPSVK